MTTIKCTEKGCGEIIQHASKGYAAALMGKHRAKHHGYVSPASKYYKGYTKRLKEKEASVKSPVPEPPVVEAINLPNFCPNCGCSMSAIMAAMNLRRRKG